MKRMALALVASAFTLSACATTGNISTDFDQSQNFSAYKVFSWAGENPMVVMGSRPVSAMVEQSIANSIRQNLEAKGYSYTPKVEDADFAVSFTVGTRDGATITQTPDYFWQARNQWNWGNVYWPRMPGATVMQTSIREYTEGTLSIDLFDVGRRAPVWHGAGQKNLTQAELRGERDRVSEDVGKILAKFPPN